MMSKYHATEPRFRIAHLLGDPVLRKAITIAEDELGPVPVLPEDKNDASSSNDARSIFHHYANQARLARARHDLVEAEFFAAGGAWASDEDEMAAFQDRRRSASAMLEEELNRFAKVPALTCEQLNGKKKLIGHVGIKTNTEYREAIARDEAYLRTRARGPRRTVAQPSEGDEAA